jgi:hypothetical protein
MVYKLLFFLAFFTPGQMFYNLEDIQCPKWVPGTDELLPQEVSLSPAMELHNKMRCFCQVVKSKERDCIDDNVPRAICLQRTKSWVDTNLQLKNKNLPNGLVNLPTRNVIVNVE